MRGCGRTRAAASWATTSRKKTAKRCGPERGLFVSKRYGGTAQALGAALASPTAQAATRRQQPATPGAMLKLSSTTRSPRVNSIIYIVGLVVVVVAVLSFFGLR
ncbi:hypothetical protein GmRootV116_31050 [Variovorax sp. V116]